MNKVVLTGRLTKDAELRFGAGSGTAVARFTIAVNRRMKKDEADFISCIAFGKTAELIVQYFQKGSAITIADGSIQTGSYEAQDGTRRYTTEVICREIEFPMGGSRNANNNNANSGNYGGAFAQPDQGFSDNSFSEDMTPIDDGDIPF